MAPGGTPSPVRVTRFNERGLVSPDGRWLAFQSDESGRNEVYVQAYPSGEQGVALSRGGGESPRWSRDGKELFYFTGDAVVSVAFRPDGSFDAPRRLVDRSGFWIGPSGASYDVSRDGKRLLMIHRDEGSVPRHLNVVLNWPDELARRVAGGKQAPAAR